MSIIPIETNINAYLSNQRVQTYIRPPVISASGILLEAARPVLLPPNTAIMDTSVLPKVPLATMKSVFSSITRSGSIPVKQALPASFDWRQKNRNITPVQNQYMCGCCWAVSVATCVSDVFVVNRFLPFNPSICWTYLISCWVNDINMKCKGSNPCLALKWIETNGIGTHRIKECNYRWCSESEQCTRNETDGDTLNQSVPGCDFARQNNVKFYTKGTIGLSINSSEAKDSGALASYFVHTKKFIMDTGPVVGGFTVFQNFLSGDFLCAGKNPSNIYLENVDYKNHRYQTLDLNSKIGSHAVVIVGWGQGMVSKSLLDPTRPQSTETVNVPYWIVRNSWSDKWGKLNGYFHMAMYPLNKNSQFDVGITYRTTVQDPQTGLYTYQDVVIGGLVGFQPDLIGYTRENTNATVVEGFQLHTAQPQKKKSRWDPLTISILCVLFVMMVLGIVIFCLPPRS